MEFLSFDIKNYKGIENLTIDLSRKPVGSIYSLVGLNESGKTTVLEAISFFNPKEKDLESLYQQGFRVADVNELVPMKKKANFNDSIQITANMLLDDLEKDDILDFAYKKLGLILNSDKLDKRFSVTKKLQFQNSIYKSIVFNWDISLYVRPKGKRKDVELYDINKEKWEKLVDHIDIRFPFILYFPTFLFEFPSRIYLQTEENESPKNAYYRSIIQDILDSLNEKLTIQEHIVDRAIDGGKFHKRSLDSVLNKMANKVSKTVFGRWNEVFDKKIPKKEIVINCETEEVKIGEENTQRIYLEFQIRDGDSIYLITERSLGFRWFFCFLLFTEFRSYRKSQSNTLFLLDEPASNLHAKAQMQLLNSFAKITESSGKIIYSTHSHYMINPHWLENTFIVRNEGLNYDDQESEYEYSSRETDIRIEKYRKFVGENPDKETYFQPILDTLAYTPSKLELVNDAIMLEGKNDYYIIEYFLSIISKKKKNLHLLPGSGAGRLDTLISLYLGWGKNFIIILDDDTAGKIEKNRYIHEWLLSNDRVFTLYDINKDWKGFKIEDLFDASDIMKLKNEYFPSQSSTKINKKELARIVQEKLLVRRKEQFSKKTLENFDQLIKFAEDQFPKK